MSFDVLIKKTKKKEKGKVENYIFRRIKNDSNFLPKRHCLYEIMFARSRDRSSILFDLEKQNKALSNTNSVSNSDL